MVAGDQASFSRTEQASQPMKVLIFELNHAGHRMSVVSMLITALIDLKELGAAITSVTVLTRAQALSSEEFRVQLGSVPGFVQVDSIEATPEPKNPLAAAIQKSNLLHRYLANHQVDHLYVPYADGLLQVEALRNLLCINPLPRKLDSEALLMRSTYAYPRQKLLTRLVSYWSVKLSPFTVLHLNDPYAIEVLKAGNDSVLKKVELIPDPLTALRFSDKRQARLALGLPEDGQLVGCVGAIDTRKGIDKLIKAFQALPPMPDCRLLLAGKHAAAINAALEKVDSPRIRSIDKYLTEKEFALSISALDVMVTPYPDFVGSASIVTRATTAGKIVVGSDFGWMRSIIGQFNLGICCDVSSQTSLTSAIMQALERAEDFEPSPSASRFVAYSAAENSYAHWTDLIRRKLTMPPDQQMVKWPSASNL